MARLIYFSFASADGYIEDADGKFDWATPDEELMDFVNDLERPVGTYLFGRRMYQTMLYWENAEVSGEPPSVQDFIHQWQSADKIVFSRTLASASSARTRLERSFSPAVIRELKQDAGRDISVGGSDLAAQAFAAGLVDELNLVLVPVSVGGGKPALPAGVRLDLELLETRRFPSGAVYLSYRPGNDTQPPGAS